MGAQVKDFMPVIVHLKKEKALNVLFRHATGVHHARRLEQYSENRQMVVSGGSRVTGSKHMLIRHAACSAMGSHVSASYCWK